MTILTIDKWPDANDFGGGLIVIGLTLIIFSIVLGAVVFLNRRGK
jgi:hypothetical protein